MKLQTRLFACVMMAITAIAPIKAQQQAQADALEQINNIKLSQNYIWAEGTSTKNKKDAMENALAVLKFEIQTWLSKNGQKDFAAVAMPSHDQCMKIETERRKVHRAFIYVEKSQIMPIGKDEKVVVVERQEPKQNKKEQKLVSTVEEIYTPTEFEKDMLSVKQSSAMEDFVNRHHINRSGKYRDRPQQGTYYIFIYNREGNVPACLKVTDNKIINLASGKDDSFDNYKGCGGLWLIPNK